MTPTTQGPAVSHSRNASYPLASEIRLPPCNPGEWSPLGLGLCSPFQGMSLPLPFKGTLTLLPISLRLAKPGAMGVCLGDLPRLGALDDHCLLPSPRAFSLQGAPKIGGPVIGLLAAKGLGERRRVSGGLHAASTSPLRQRVPSAVWSWAPRSGPSSCPRPALPSLGVRCCGPTSHCHHCCCHWRYSHRHPRGSLGPEKPLGHRVSACPS